MKPAFKKEIDGRKIRIYRAEGENLPVIYSNEYMESGGPVLDQCEKIGCPPFHLVTLAEIGWDQNMSPWPSQPVVTAEDQFEGQAPAYLQWLLEKVVPYAQEKLGENNPVSYLAGYSMAGLFALWAMYETDFFAGAACSSGSLWYPGFLNFALGHEFAGRPEGIYLSLGDRESAVKNEALRTTETVFRTLRDHYAEKQIPCVFELNPGNHYRNVPLRVARGYRWLLEH